MPHTVTIGLLLRPAMGCSKGQMGALNWSVPDAQNLHGHIAMKPAHHIRERRLVGIPNSIIPDEGGKIAGICGTPGHRKVRLQDGRS